MSFYECTFIVRHDMSPSDVTKLTEQYAAVITEHKGKVLRTENWGLRQLAYPINKATKGHYVMFALETPFEALHEMERQMRINEDIVRVLTVKHETLDANKLSVMLRQRSNDETEAA